jgi:hypothetical protein
MTTLGPVHPCPQDLGVDAGEGLLGGPLPV